jgi:hypothetical protein
MTQICMIGKHPTDERGRVTSYCGGFAPRQCCDVRSFPDGSLYGPCKLHKCGPRKGSRCPLPNTEHNEV